MLNLKALNYIYKLDPILEERVKTILDVIPQNKFKKQAVPHVNKQESRRSLLTSCEGSKKIIIDEIIAIETDTLRCKTIVKTLDEAIKTRKNLKELLEALPSNFIKSHRSIVLNLDYIKEISIRDGYHHAIMMSGESYDISRNYIKALSQSFNKGIF